jgi:hypothetical protein
VVIVTARGHDVIFDVTQGDLKNIYYGARTSVT